MTTPPRYSPAQLGLFIKFLGTLTTDTKLDRIEQLDDGVVFAELLRHIDPTYEPALTLPITTWVQKKENLESVFKALDAFLGSLPELAWVIHSYKPKEIARDRDVNGLAEAAAVLIFVTMTGPHTKSLLSTVWPTLSQPQQTLLMEFHQQKSQESGEVFAASTGRKTKELEDALKDYELQAEATFTQIQNLKKQNADLMSRIERLHESLADLKDDNERIRQELDKARSQDAGNAQAFIKDLKDQLLQNNEIIQRHEDTIEEDRQLKIRLKTELDQLTKQAAESKELREEVEVLRHEKDELSKKANMADRYKEKLARLQNLESELKSTQYENSQLRQETAKDAKLRIQVEALRSTIEDYRQWQAKHETDLSDMREQKMIIAEQLTSRTQELQRLADQKAIDEAMINDLRDQITSGGISGRESPEPGQESHEDTIASLKLEMAKIKAENNLLRDNMGIASTADQLRAELDKSIRNEAHLTEKLHEMRKDLALSQDQCQALLGKMTEEGSQAYVDMQKSLRKTQADLEKEKERSRKLESEVKDRDRELLSLKTDCMLLRSAYMGNKKANPAYADKVATQDSVDALQELKSTDQLISASLRDELNSLRSAHEGLKLDNQEQQKQLIDALLTREKIRKELSETIANGVPTADGDAQGEVDRDTNRELLEKQAEKLAKFQEKTKSLLQQLEKSDQERYELRRQLKAAEGGAAFAALKAASDQKIRNLERENNMMSTAWYDLTSRLQSNHVVLQRRQDMPKSWLNKQRQMVNGMKPPPAWSTFAPSLSSFVGWGDRPPPTLLLKNLTEGNVNTSIATPRR